MTGCVVSRGWFPDVAIDGGDLDGDSEVWDPGRCNGAGRLWGKMGNALGGWVSGK